MSFCITNYSGSIIWSEVICAAQIILGVFMCLLIALEFTKQAIHMYTATKRLCLNRYMNLLVREGLVYFLVYVHKIGRASCRERVSPRV